MSMKAPGIARFAAFDDAAQNDVHMIEPIKEPKTFAKRNRKTIRATTADADNSQLSMSTSEMVDLANPAEVAMFAARYDALNQSLHSLAKDRAQDELRFKIEKSELERALAKKCENLETAEQEIADLKKEIAHARELVDAVKGSAPYQFGKLMKVFALSLAASSGAAIAFTLFTF